MTGTMRHTRLAEPADYLDRREELRLAEIELMRQRERVAALRRALPPGAVVDDYLFQEGPASLDAGDEPVTEIRLSGLFTGPPDRALIIYHFMYGKKQTSPCPMCTMWIDGFNGTAAHLARNADFAIAAAAGPATLRAHARSRGWANLRLLSSGSPFKYDLGSEDQDGNQDSTVSVFTRDSDGTLRHRYSAHPRMDSGIDQRGIDLLSPVWHLLDLTPHGRGDWYASLDYGQPVWAPGGEPAGT